MATEQESEAPQLLENNFDPNFEYLIGYWVNIKLRYATSVMQNFC